MKKTILSKALGAALAIALVISAVMPIVTAAYFEFHPVTELQNVILSLIGTPGEATVTWWDTSGADVYYGVDPQALSSTAPAKKAADYSAVYNFSVYTAVMTGLAAGESYYYKIGEDGDPTSFVMPNHGTDAFTFMYLGDVQASDTGGIEDWGGLINGAYEKNPKLGFGIIGGDLVNNGQVADEWQAFLRQAEDVFSHIPLFTVPGNHECNSSGYTPDMYLNMLSLPENGPSGFSEEFYSFDYGNAHFLMLNSNIFERMSGGSAVVDEWIREDLMSSDAAWKIVVLHHPPYKVVSDGIAQKVFDNWVPLFEEAEVDIVFCGHQHVYMRTYPMYENKRDDKNGITYIMGNSGSKFYQTAYVPYSDVMLGNTSLYQIVNVSADALEILTYDKNGELADSYVAYPKNRGSLPPPEGTPGDTDGDGTVSYSDLRLVIEAVLARDYTNTTMDIDKNGVIDIRDVHLIALMLR